MAIRREVKGAPAKPAGARPGAGKKAKPRVKKPAAKAKKVAAKTSRAGPAHYARLASEFALWRPSGEVLQEVEAVPTRFVWLDWATRCGGFPIRRVVTMSGPPSGGKTELLLGLGLSFLERGHWYGYADAERTTPPSWVRTMYQEIATSPAFLAIKPDSFEQAVDAVDEFGRRLQAWRDKGRVAQATTGLVGLDSLSKLVPRHLLDKMLAKSADSAKGSVDGMDGAAGREIAALNAQWFRRLTPLLDDCRIGLVAILRERENVNRVGRMARRWKVSGGTDPAYEASIGMRVTKAFEERRGPGAAVRHVITINKSKVGRLVEPLSAFFHVRADGGFDRERDVLTLAERLGAVRQISGKRPRYVIEGDGEEIPGPEDAAVAHLRESPDTAQHLEARCRALFNEVPP